MKEKDYSKKILTIPNLMSLFRILLIPFILYSFWVLNNNVLAFVLIVISGISDVLDGKVARRFNMVSDFGKMFDPIADKITQIALVICLVTKFKLIIPLLVFLLIKEAFMGISGVILVKKTGKMDQAKWYGKACTAALYTSMMLMILFPEMPVVFADILIGICAVFMIISLAFYSIVRIKAIRAASK